jgi:hypothetical protein
MGKMCGNVCCHGNAVKGLIYLHRHLELSNCKFSICINISRQSIQIDITQQPIRIYVLI